ncbi:adenylate/guanylate cyclase domain-containing protein [Enterovirga sp.]|uniref:adenylate/guanylate cyclase domain-containing protein n=1 Tax=Enterovirga sp. TaxID=2026350 RepID=UPI002C3DB2BC|nr:adenylate/guanylate cyclase domain-containing protein [Enterovirga sp.]HMO29033.1 adenylate/guanylate cyclase domain-containing protein [Enterovirga sp.]
MNDDPDPASGPAQPGLLEDESLPRTITAILAADIAGFSRMVANDEEGTLRRMGEYSRIFRDTIERHRGRVFNTAGDAILAEFPSAVAALRAGLEVQTAHRALNESLAPTERLQFRMGINVGDVVQSAGDLLGDGVNIAARLEGIAEPGGISISRSVHDAVGNKVPSRMRFMGRQRLKNIAKPVEVYRVRLPTDPEEGGVGGPLLALAVLLLLLGGGGAAFYYRDKLPEIAPFLKRERKADAVPAPPRVALAITVARPTQRCFNDVVRVTGRFVPHREVEVRPEADGVQVLQVDVKPMAEVRAGDTLAKVAPIGLGEGAATAIRAPVAGVVGKSTAMVGMPAGISAPPLFTIIADGKMDFAADIPAEGLDRLKVGQPAEIKPLGGTAVSGKVALISRSVEIASQLGRATIGVGRNPDLQWGLFGRGTVQVGESCGLAVPTAAVMHDGEATVVYVAVNDVIEARQVVTGSSSANEVEIRSGLTASDQVVQRAGPFLREGDRVAPIPAPIRSVESR